MTKQRPLRFLIIFPIAMVMLVIVLLISLTTPSFVKNIIQSQVVHDSINVLQQIKTLRGYYTQHVVKKIQDNTDMLVAIEHYNKANTIPLPATMIHDLSELFDKNGSEIRLYSQYPFPQRANRQLDSFEESAWQALNEQPQEIIEGLVEQGGKSYLRVAIADQMQVQTCVTCHNTHPLTPKANWRLGDVRGVLEMSTDITEQMALAEQISRAIVMFIVVACILLIIIFFFLTRRITKQVSYISKAMVELGDGNFDAKVDVASSTLEIGQMAQAFSTFKQALLKTQALEKRQQLMESEKIDALGRMLASVAHDVNTPISVGITAASLMADKIKSIEEKIEKGELTKSEMDKFIASATESMQVVSSNLVSAGNLIKSFKQVSVDQISEEQRQIMLSEYIKEIVHSLKPRITRAKATVLVECQQDCQFYTYPGLLSQVVSNLITNSLIHGFGQQPDGKIVITLIGSADGQIEIHYQDDGIGIPKEHQEKVMEPFFTTKREQGGSGLGLSIIHSIVTQKLAGKIELVSKQGQGVTFKICFPAKCPSKEAKS